MRAAKDHPELRLLEDTFSHLKWSVANCAASWLSASRSTERSVEGYIAGLGKVGLTVKGEVHPFLVG